MMSLPDINCDKKFMQINFVFGLRAFPTLSSTPFFRA
jgi:hypothetical protein